MEELLSFDDVKKSDAWKYLSERSSEFEVLVNKFLSDAKVYVSPIAFTATGIFVDNEGIAVNYETNYYGMKKFVLSYNSKEMNRDLDCQFRVFRRIEFSLNDSGNLIVNDLSGRLESKYGYRFEDDEDAILKTNYSYQEYTPEGIELLYRGYDDQLTIPKDQLFKYRHLRGSICGGYNPRLNEFNGSNVQCNGFYGKNPTLVEKVRTVDNKGLVRVTTINYGSKGEIANKNEEYCFNTFINYKENADPFLIHINRGIPPIARMHNGRLVINYRNLKVNANNFGEVARVRFVMEVRNKLEELVKLKRKVSKNDKEQRTLIDERIRKYQALAENDQQRWVLKDERGSTKK